MSDYRPQVTLSSAYIVMLRRHLSLILSPSSKQPYQYSNTIANGYLERQVDLAELEKISAILLAKTGNRGFGLEIGNNIHPSDYGIIGYVLMNSSTLYDAVKLAAQYKQLLNKGLTTKVERKGKLVHYCMENTLNLEVMQAMVELDFASAFQFADLLAGPHKPKRISFKRVEFRHQALSPLKHYQECFQCPVSFGRTQNRIIVDAEELDIPVYGANPKILTMLQRKLHELHGNRHPKTLSANVRVHLNKQLRNEFPDATKVATFFHMSLSSFKKNLSLEQTNFQQICDDLRCDDAQRLLNEGKKSIKEIAYLQGYSSTSAFTRAFKRWTNVNPNEYKNAQRLQSQTN